MDKAFVHAHHTKTLFAIEILTRGRKEILMVPRRLAVWLSGNGIAHFNKVAPRRAWLVLEWVYHPGI